MKAKAEIIPSLTTGTELDIVNAARRSFDVTHKSMTKGDISLINFLVRWGHWLPFRHPQLSFSCDAPIFVARQLGKHQVGMSWSEVSRRYKTGGFDFWEPEAWREKPEDAKQGTGPELEQGAFASVIAQEALEQINKNSMDTYRILVDDLGLAPEQVRAMLPQSMMVSWTWTGSLMAWLHLIRERAPITSHSQTETREWVTQYIVPEIAKRFPYTWEAIQTHTALDITNEQANEEAREVRGGNA